jgi:hypothetical protein
MQVVSLGDHIAEIDADTKLNPLVLYDIGVVILDRVLDFYGTANSVDHATELRQQAVAYGLEDTTPMGCDLWLDGLANVLSYGCPCAFLVGTDEAAVTDHVGHENCRKTAFNAFLGHTNGPSS